jgi:hypothetical protein
MGLLMNHFDAIVIGAGEAVVQRVESDHIERTPENPSADADDAQVRRA